MINKKIYVDFYHPIFEEDGLTTKEIIHLDSMEIITDTVIREIVEELKIGIFERYGDGLYIQSEEFANICYLNILIMFGKEYNFLVEYLDSINTQPETAAELINTNQDVFLSVDHISDQDEVDNLINLLNENGIESKPYLIKRKVFERGAGDYHENVILGLITGAAEAIGGRLANIIMDKFSDYQKPRFNSLNMEQILNFTSVQTGINKHDLHITKIDNISEDKIEIFITNRYKNIKVFYVKTSNEINLEVMSKTYSMI